MTVEEFLHDLQTRASKEFPDAGLLVYAVIDSEEEDTREIICVTNMDDEEIDEVLEQVGSEHLEIAPTPRGRQLS